MQHTFFLISKKKNKFARAAHFFFQLAKKKNKFVRVARFFVFICRYFARLQCRFVLERRQTSQLHIIFMEELSYVLTEDFVSCVHARFYFFTAALFHLAANISHFLTAAIPPLWNFHVFLSTKFVLPSSFSVIHASLNIKNNGEKRHDFLVFLSL